jgi:hypothetical protein
MERNPDDGKPDKICGEQEIDGDWGMSSGVVGPV